MNEKQVAERAIACLDAGTPFSAIRLGDGEGRILLWPSGITRAQLNRHLRFWFGSVNSIMNRDIAAWKRALLLAVSRADVVGYYHGEERNHYWRAARDLVHTKPDAILCENRLHRDLWDSGLLTEIMAAAQRIVLVTCRDVPREEGTEVILIPEEAHTLGARNDHPAMFAAICTAVQKHHAAPGILFLVGAGLFGKIYCDVARQAGAVAIDIGSVFDGWAGVQSRTYLTQEQKRYTIEGEANASADDVPA